MAKSYDEKMDDQYIGNMGSVYKEGKAQVDALIWQYATGEAKAEREANVNRIAENWGVSKEKADVLYTAMAGVHTIAAIGGAVYGMKTVSVSTGLSMADTVKQNIAISQKARKSSNFAIHSAKSDQLQWGYAADEWSMSTLPAGSKIYGGIPGQSAYYTTEQTLLNANFGRESLFKSLQVAPHPEFGYRPQVGVYEVTNDITIPSGIVRENPLLGPGGGSQLFIRDYNNNLKLIDKIDLGK